MSAQTSRESAHILENWWRRLEPRGGDDRRVLVDELRDRSIDCRAGGAALATGGALCERKVVVGWVGVTVVVMRCAARRAP